jgi:heme/copper-type cytochrome/quinol oxidase subunit 3
LKGTPSIPAQSRAPGLSASASNRAIARFGFLLFLGSESMLFMGLLGALAVFRWRADRWPPLGLPRLPVAVTAANTLLLFSSTLPIAQSLRALRGGDAARFARSLALATLLGIGFLAVQGSEWVRLVGAGLRASSGPYGATFFALIGCHALHVLGAVVWLVILLVGARQGRFTVERHLPVELGAIYWYYVSAVWAVIFPFVYLGLR